MQKSHVDMHLYLTRQCSANTQATVLFHAGNESTDWTQLYTLWWTFVIPVGVSYMVSLRSVLHRQSGNYLNASSWKFYTTSNKIER